MTRILVFVVVLILMIGCTLMPYTIRADEPPAASDVESIPPPTTLAEAQSRARLLHEAIRGTLQVMHRDFFDEDDTHAIPSASLEEVFDELAHSYGVKMKWLIVETDNINVDHQPEDEFEKAAVKALKAGEPRHEAVETDRYRFAGPIRLASQCLKCHVRNRTRRAAVI